MISARFYSSLWFSLFSGSRANLPVAVLQSMDCARYECPSVQEHGWWSETSACSRCSALCRHSLNDECQEASDQVQVKPDGLGEECQEV